MEPKKYPYLLMRAIYKENDCIIAGPIEVNNTNFTGDIADVFFFFWESGRLQLGGESINLNKFPFFREFGDPPIIIQVAGYCRTPDDEIIYEDGEGPFDILDEMKPSFFEEGLSFLEVHPHDPE